MKVTVLSNSKASGAAETLPQVLDALKAVGAETILAPAEESLLSSKTDAFIARGDVVIALGGDGTIIHFAKRAALFNRPLLGINCGRLGFMAGLESHELNRLSDLIAGKYQVETRNMLDVTVMRGGEKILSLPALNEAVISRGSTSRMVQLEVLNAGNPVMSYRADGVILSTPTGSTAYSLSAGGPVIDPKLNCLLMTPVCPHSLYARPYIFHSDAELEVRPASDAVLMVDGESNVALCPQDTVCVRYDGHDVRLIKLKSTSFFDVIHDKLMTRI